ncbi:N-6 DNA methylase [Desulfovibrio sulfodismutans]|uniref:site-specific DNA-methyltransferase (adenine-specific) n=1 Tax=Desulfolutivibrio sulfodismutans TaxID=63561 RepID=A0A7K3NHD8_9BACT|nr:N-6 DNA methylase [Desulfolutivibrio sulfodismutans]NDY55614.1 N-6 DNA methylase [Desulfolutivibrio sulfodismutans]QLA11684.1 N-6 DNA methylase [Desulfolutivibrio sulfodismutans DSM 3696]
MTRYSKVEKKKRSGATFTPENLSKFLSKKISKLLTKDKNEEINILDPAVGDGQLLFSMANELKSIGYCNIVLHGFDTDKNSTENSIRKLSEIVAKENIHIIHKDFLEHVLESSSYLPLFQENKLIKYDIIIANPPYVRTQIMGEIKAKQLSSSFDLKGRVDLYYPFILSIGKALKEGGVAGIITSNRYLTIKSGASVRREIRKVFSLKNVYDLGDTKVFDAAILPAIMICGSPSRTHHNNINFSSIYETDETSNIKINDIFEAFEHEGVVTLSGEKNYLVKNGILDDGGDSSNVWRLSTNACDEWLKTVEENTWCRFEDVGKIRVGVKTTADSVFIRDDWEFITNNKLPELLKPLITHHQARRFKGLITNKKQKFILYTHIIQNGKRTAINLNEYPKSKAYLEKFKLDLEKRTYVINAGRQWYEIWVPQNPAHWENPKLIMRDISEEPCFWMDLDGSVVNGDCYWMIADKKTDKDILWLTLGVANSKFIETYYDKRFNNKLYSGRRRFMTQYVKEFPLPNINLNEAQEIIRLSKDLYQEASSDNIKDIETKLNNAVLKAFNISC